MDAYLRELLCTDAIDIEEFLARIALPSEAVGAIVCDCLGRALEHWEDAELTMRGSRRLSLLRRWYDGRATRDELGRAAHEAWERLPGRGSHSSISGQPTRETIAAWTLAQALSGACDVGDLLGDCREISAVAALRATHRAVATMGTQGHSPHDLHRAAWGAVCRFATAGPSVPRASNEWTHVIESERARVLDPMDWARDVPWAVCLAEEAWQRHYLATRL